MLTPSSPTLRPSHSQQSPPHDATPLPPPATTTTTTAEPSSLHDNNNNNPTIPIMPEDDDDASSHSPETVCTMVVHELDPRSILRWPINMYHSVHRAGTVLMTLRHTTISDVISGVLQTILLFTFSAVFGSAIFAETGLNQYVGLGVEVHLLTVLITQAGVSFWSQAPLGIAGPDVNPTIFISSMCVAVRDAMIALAQVQQVVDATSQPTAFNTTSAPSLSTNSPSMRTPTGKPAVGHHRLLQNHPSSQPTIAQDVPTDGIMLDQTVLLSTVLATITIFSGALGTFLYLLGRLRLARGVQLLPGSVLAGFMASIGYLVLVKAIKTSMDHETYITGPSTPKFWLLFLPSIPIGLAMYAQKRYHWGNPVTILPLILFVPLIMFFSIAYGKGCDIECCREQGWLYETFQSESFQTQYVDSYGTSGKVEWQAITAAVPTMIVGVFVVSIDVLMKAAAIRKLLKVHDLSFDHEMMLMGKVNILNALFVGAPGYAQPKLVSINLSIIHNTTSRVPGLIVLILLGFLFLLGFPLINYLPRFWLAGVLVFAAMGFLVENLWDGRTRFSRKEFASIWAIVLINALFGLAWSILVGIVLAALIFAMAYSRSGAVKHVSSGRELRSSVHRSPEAEAKLAHLGSRVGVFQLHHYIFFGSASYVAEVVDGLVKAQEHVPAVQRVTYFVFDWAQVEDIDVTATDVMLEMFVKLMTHGKEDDHDHHRRAPRVEVDEATTALTSEYKQSSQDELVILFTGMSQQLRTSMQSLIQFIHEPSYASMSAKSKGDEDDLTMGIIGSHKRCFDTLDGGLEWIEDRLLQRAEDVRRAFHKYESFRKWSCRSPLLQQYDAFEYVMGRRLGKTFWDYFEILQVPRGWTLCQAGVIDPHLYVVRSGCLTKRDVHNHRLITLRRNAVVNEEMLSSIPSYHTTTADDDSTVFAISKERAAKLEVAFPDVAIELHRAVLAFVSAASEKYVKTTVLMAGGDNQSDTPPATRTATAVLLAHATPRQQQSLQMFNGGEEDSNNNTNNGDPESALPMSLGTSAMDENPSLARRGSFSLSSSDSPSTKSRSMSSLAAGPGNFLRSTGSAVTGVAGNALQTVSETTGLVAETTKSIVSTGLILSGFKADDEAGTGLLDTSVLVSGSGGRQGRKLAKLFAARVPLLMRSNSNSMRSPTLSASGRGTRISVREVRSAMVPADFEDGADVRAVLYAAFRCSRRQTRAPTKMVPDSFLELRLCHPQIVTATAHFCVALAHNLPRTPSSGDEAPDNVMSSLELPRDRLPALCRDMGFFEDVSSHHVSGRTLRLEQFLQVVTRLTLSELTSKEIDGFRSVYNKYCPPGSQQPGWTVKEFESLMRDFGEGDVLVGGGALRLVQKWNSAKLQMHSSAATQEPFVDFGALCSMFSSFLKLAELDVEFEKDWGELAGVIINSPSAGEPISLDAESQPIEALSSPGGGASKMLTLTADRIVQVFGVPLGMAERIVWEMDSYDYGGVIPFEVLLGELVTKKE